MAKKKTVEDAADAFLRAQGVNPLEFMDVAGLDKLTEEQIAEIARKASQGDPEARTVAEKLVAQGRLRATPTPTGRVFDVVTGSTATAVRSSTKPEIGKPATAAEQIEAQQALERDIAKKKAAKPAGEEVAVPARPEQDAQKQKLVQSAKEEKARQASAEAAAELEKPAPAAKIEEGELRQTGSEADRLAALKKRNFKAEWGRLPKPAKEKILEDAFGARALALNEATKQKLGEIAVAREAFKQSALTSIPDMDDTLKSIDDLQERLGKAADTTDFRQLQAQLKTVEQSVNIKHQRLLTGQSGKIRGNLLQFRKPRAGEIGSAKIGETEVARPKPESGVEERSPGFDKAKVAEVPVNAKNAKGKKSVDDVGLPEAGAVAAEAAAEAAGTPAPAAVSAAADKEMAERSAKYKAITDADPKKYGAGSGLKASKSWTPEQSAARKELRKTLGYPDKFVRKPRAGTEPAAPAAAPSTAAPAAPAAGKPGRIQMTEEEKKAWGNAVRADKTKYGTSARKATEVQKAARNDLAAKIVAGRRGGAAAPATAPAAPATTAPAMTAPAAPPTAPTSGGAPVPAAAPAAATAPAAAGKPTASEVLARAKRIYGGGVGKTLSGAMRWLGPLAAIYGAYQVLDMLKQGTIDEADERRLKAMQALGAVSGGMGADLESKAQVAQMQRMVDMAAIQRQKARDEMQNRYVSDQALNSLLAGHQASLAALAQPSRPSIAEMMARM